MSQSGNHVYVDKPNGIKVYGIPLVVKKLIDNVCKEDSEITAKRVLVKVTLGYKKTVINQLKREKKNIISINYCCQN